MRQMLHVGRIFLALCLPLLGLQAQTPTPETEPNNTRQTANAVQLNQTITGQVSTLTDPDYFNFGVLPAGAYKLVLRYPQGMGPNGKDWFNLLDANDKEIPGFCYYPADGSHVYLFLICGPTNAMFKIHPNTDLGLTGKPYEFSVVKDVEDLAECNNTLATARQLTQSGAYKGKIGTLEDFIDIVYLKDLPAGDLKVRVSYPNASNPKLLVGLGKITPQPLIVQAPNESTNVEISEKIAQKSDYYLTIQHFEDSMTMLTPYDLVIDFKPACTLSINTAAIQIDSATCPLSNGRIEIPVPTTGLEPFTYRLNANAAQSSPVFQNLAGGVYSIIATDSQNCADTVSVTVACKPCPPPIAGINKVQDNAARKVTFKAVIASGTILEWSFGDGTKSTDLNPAHEYQATGNYTVVLTAQNACGTATASITVVVIAGDFALGQIKNAKPGTEVKVPFFSKTFEGTMMTFAATLPDSIKWDFVRFANGTIPIQNQTFSINSPEGRFSFLFGSNGFSVKPGDTLFYLVLRLKPNLPPGDSILLNLTGGKTPFEILARVGNELSFVDAGFMPGRIDIIRNVKFQIKAQGPKGDPAKGRATVVSAGNSYVFDTDANGKIQGEVIWSDTITVSMRRDTVTLDGINIVDVVLFNRAYVGLATNGQTPYTILAGDFDEDGKFTPKDISMMLNFLVGNVNFQPQKQFWFVAATYQMPVWPSPDYFKPETNYLVVNPDPGQTAVWDFVTVQKGDGDHSNPNLNRSHAVWHYEEQADANGFVTVQVYAGADAAQGAQLDLRFDNNYTFLGVETLQRNITSAFNPSSGRLRAALLQNGDFDHEQPLLALRFRAPQPNNGRAVLLPASAGHAADREGNASEVSFQSLHTLSDIAINVWPNPANKLLQVRCAQSGSHTLELFDTAGKLRYHGTTDGAVTAEIPVETLPAGPYLLKIHSSARTSIQRIVVAH